jgi:hypothetical protein
VDIIPTNEATARAVHELPTMTKRAHPADVFPELETLPPVTSGSPDPQVTCHIDITDLIVAPVPVPAPNRTQVVEN